MNQQEKATVRPDGVVRVTIPARVAYDLSSFQKSIAVLVERLGCRTCFSGADCSFQLERDFVINEALEVRANPEPQPWRLAQEPDPVPWSVSARLPTKVSYNLEQVQSAVARIAGRLGCEACCSGFDINFLQEREFLFDQNARIRG